MMDSTAHLEILPHTLEKTATDGDSTLLQISISVPELPGGTSRRYRKINRFYRDVCRLQLGYAQREPLRRAARARADSMQQADLFAPHRYEVTYKILCASDDILSLYWDSAEHLPGQDSATVRHVDNWDLAAELPVSLSLTGKQRKRLIDELIARGEAAARVTGRFYENTAQNIKRYFRADQCARTPDGLVVFYPLYSLAPYACGFPEFQIPGRFPFQ